MNSIPGHLPESDRTGLVIGIDIGGTNLRLALVDSKGIIIKNCRMCTEIGKGRDAFIEKLFAGIDSLIRAAADLLCPVLAVGAGIPGLVSPSGFVCDSVNLRPLDQFNLAAAISEHTSLPATVMNDANAAAYGELTFGAGRPFASFLMVTLGTGVGGGLVLNHTVWTGIDGAAGEFGHVTVEPEGIPCSCGNRGCLEQYSSATALKRLALNHGWKSLSEMGRAASRGNLTAQGLFSTVGSYLGIASSSVVNLLNIEAIIIGGGMSRSFELFAGNIRDEIKRRVFPIPAARVDVLLAELGDNSGVLGGAARAWAMVSQGYGELS